MLIPSYPMSEFKKLKADQVKKLKSCVLTSDGQYICTVIVPQTDDIQIQVEYLGNTSNSVGGKELKEV